MTNIKALEDLRELCASVKSMDFASVGCDAVLEIADRINDEIAEQFMPLPCDADGVPIRAGDVMARVDGGPTRQVACVCGAGFTDIDTPIWCARDFRHVKPRTIEDVLLDVIEHAVCPSNSWDEIIAKYADEIREVLGVKE